MSTKNMFYVAADPNQLDGAWAAIMDRPEDAEDIAQTLIEYVRGGAVIMHVDGQTTRDMLGRWGRKHLEQLGESSEDV